MKEAIPNAMVLFNENGQLTEKKEMDDLNIPNNTGMDDRSTAPKDKRTQCQQRAVLLTCKKSVERRKIYIAMQIEKKEAKKNGKKTVNDKSNKRKASNNEEHIVQRKKQQKTSSGKKIAKVAPQIEERRGSRTKKSNCTSSDQIYYHDDDESDDEKNAVDEIGNSDDET